MPLPALINELILLVNVAGLGRRHHGGDAPVRQAATTFRPLEVYLAAACIYLMINLCLAVLGRYLEHRTV